MISKLLQPWKFWPTFPSVRFAKQISTFEIVDSDLYYDTTLVENWWKEMEYKKKLERQLSTRSVEANEF